MGKKILILGAGFGGLETATGLGEALQGRGDEITLVDRSDSFFVGFAKIDVLFGRRRESEVRYRYAELRAPGLRFVQASIDAIDLAARSVSTSAGSFAYDYLVIALGAELAPQATPGFVESGGHELYSMAGAVALRPVIDAFTQGRFVIGVLGLPYKCPPAPYEVACQLHELFVKKGIRDRVELSVVTPGPRPVPNPKVAEALERLLAERGIALHAGTPIASVDAARRELVLGERRIGYDCFVGVPVHVPPAVVKTAGLGQGFIPVSITSLETSAPGVYAIGDVAKVAVGETVVPKAGAFAEDAARTVVSDILVNEGLVPEREKFRAKGACYLEVAEGQVAKVDADFFGGDQPRQIFEGPSSAFHADKLAFERTRRDRWFRG